MLLDQMDAPATCEMRALYLQFRERVDGVDAASARRMWATYERVFTEHVFGLYEMRAITDIAYRRNPMNWTDARIAVTAEDALAPLRELLDTYG